MFAFWGHQHNCLITASSSSFPVLFLLEVTLGGVGDGEGDGEGDDEGDGGRGCTGDAGDGGGRGAFSSCSISFSSFIRPGGSTLYLWKQRVQSQWFINGMHFADQPNVCTSRVFKKMPKQNNMNIFVKTQLVKNAYQKLNSTWMLSGPTPTDRGRLLEVACEELKKKCSVSLWSSENI